MGFPDGSGGKEAACNAGDTGAPGLISRSGGSPGGGHGKPLQRSCWRIPWTEEPGELQSMGSVHGIAESWTWLSARVHSQLHKGA